MDHLWIANSEWIKAMRNLFPSSRQEVVKMHVSCICICIVTNDKCPYADITYVVSSSFAFLSQYVFNGWPTAAKFNEGNGRASIVRLYADVDTFLAQTKQWYFPINALQLEKHVYAMQSVDFLNKWLDFLRVCVLISCVASPPHCEKKKHLSRGAFPYFNSTGGRPASPSSPHAGGQEPR